MAAGKERGGTKRKRTVSVAEGRSGTWSKKPKESAPKPAKLKLLDAKKSKEPGFKASKPPKSDNKASVRSKEPQTPKERRLASKEMSESRKKKRKPNYHLEKELASLWEKMRRYNVGNEERSKLVTQALQKMNGKYLEIAGSHVLARVFQTCVKYCTQEERDSIFDALRPHLLALSCKKYAVHLVKKILDHASKKQLEVFISSLHGHVTALLRHSVGSAVIDYVFHLASGSQKQSLLVEMYSTELQLFKDLTLTNSGRLVDIISRLQLQKSSVVRHMYSVFQSLIEKGIVNHSIVHKAILEFFTIADKSSAADVIQQLIPLLVQDSLTEEDNPQISAPETQKKRKNKSKNVKEPLLARMVRTRDGLKICIICVKHATAKERKKIIKGVKSHIRKLSLDQFGSLLLVCTLSVVDDTKLLTKIVIQELQTMLKELVLDKNGRRMILQLLHPHSSLYFTPEDLVCLNLSVASLFEQADETKDVSEINQVPVEQGENFLIDNNEKEGRIVQSATGSKKDSFRRRHELLVESGLAEGLFGICIDNIGDLLCSNFGKDVVYELAVGGSDGILQSFTDRINALHEAIASLAVLPKTNETEEEHVFENFHSSRLIRKLVLNSPSFATTLWKMALEGKCDIWAQGHSSKILHAFLQSSVSSIQDLAKPELQLLMDRDVLKAPDSKLPEKAADS
ncbi:pumilio homolog 24-like [Zingiber officinale]|uniref:pumilio homolog 24-like n=1 Tax=Zingiber officinale TaxID=94328 RepID=UPI001C4CB182|nr:pumilio homolog 24-like [Zingiber officinale]